MNVVELAKKCGLGLWDERSVELTNKELQAFANAVLEEAAKVCLRGDNEYNNGIECAAAIRKMKGE